MPFILFDDRPVDFGGPILEHWDSNPGIPIGFSILENLINSETGEMFDPPLVKPDRKTNEWHPGHRGELLFMRKDGTNVYYRFKVMKAPKISKVAGISDDLARKLLH